MESIGETLKKSTVDRFNTVNSKEKDINTVNSNPSKNEALVAKICNLIEQENIQPEGIAIQLAELLDDKRSLPYYILLVKEHNPGELFSAAYQTREKAELGMLRKSKPIYFIGILRKKGFKTKFR
ncbi:MAG TPA: hypothetical protein VG935_03225 [Patescibacteria group bacterium]|nr:hypothetical protein [Patescibacteria group bacterium]